MVRLFLAVALLFISAHAVFAQQWPQWRGPSRDGSVPAASVPAEWPASFERAWRVDVGEGYSSPVVANGRVFIHSRKDPQEIVTAIDIVSGKVMWEQTYAAGYQKNQYAVRMGKGPNATPLIADGRLFTIGATAILTAWDAASGRQLWRKDFSTGVDLSKLFCGTAASPVLVRGLVVVQVGSDVHGGQIVAFDPATGAMKWEWKGAGPGYASPALIDVAGSAQIVTLTNGSVIGLDAVTGKELWATPFANEWHENIATPVWTGAELVVSSTQQGTNAYKLTRSAAGAWTAARSWKNADVTMYMSTPIAADGVIYGLSDKKKGSFVAIDAKTGALKWQTEGREGTNAVLLLTPRHVLFLTDGAALVVIRRDAAKFSLEKKYELPLSATWATPVLMGRDLIVRDATGVARLTGK